MHKLDDKYEASTIGKLFLTDFQFFSFFLPSQMPIEHLASFANFVEYFQIPWNFVQQVRLSIWQLFSATTHSSFDFFAHTF
jgi:hypothetical protein